MAACGEEELQLDLEFDVGFNEFEEELQQKSHELIENVCQQSCSDKSATKLEVKNVHSTSHSSKMSNSQNTSQGEIKYDQVFIGEDEGELQESEEEMDLKTPKESGISQDEISKTKNILDKHSDNSRAVSSKRKMEDDIAMEIDEDSLLESEDGLPLCSEKKCKVESTENNTGQNNEDHICKPKKKSTRGGRKKRKKVELDFQRIKNQAKPQIGRLFKPITATEDDSAECVAHQLAERLEEEKGDLILRVVKILGQKKALEIFQETRRMQIKGGLYAQDSYRRKKTSGGVFLFIMKHKGYATKEQVKEIYADEREKEKQRLREYKKRCKELEEMEVQDLRELLQKKRETLSKLETENKAET